jgi:tripartite-type tricarboxylate transporter receptor subunit TctC
VTTLKRSPLLPDVPTISESGLRGFDVSTWFGIFAPAGTPPDVVAKLNGEIVRVLHTNDMRERLALLGAEPIGNKPDEFAAFIKTEIPKYAKVVKASGAKAD